MSDGAGEGADGGDEAECDAYVTHQPRVDQRARKALEVEGHALFLAGVPGDVAAGRLAPAVEADLRARLAVACGGQQAEVELSVLAVTSPDGDYAHNPRVLAAFG